MSLDTETYPTAPAVTDRMIDDANAELADIARNDAEPTGEDIADMARATMAIDLSQCDPAPHNGHWCPRCGIGCCTVTRNDDGNPVCGCDRHGRHDASLGKIDAWTAPTFLAAVLLQHGRNDFLTIDAAGNVAVQSRFTPVERTELIALKSYVATHNIWCAAVASLTAA